MWLIVIIELTIIAEFRNDVDEFYDSKSTLESYEFEFAYWVSHLKSWESFNPHLTCRPVLFPVKG